MSFSPKFSYETRQKNLQKLDQIEFDLLVVGGGITGAGVARDAASRGMSVALVEANDFAFGTSSRSSKLIHGGIRYLENLEFHLVFEALSERKVLFEIAPHLVHPLRFVLPLYKGGRVGMFKMGLGMWLYDALSLFEAPMLHQKLSPTESLNDVPELRKEDLLGSYAYADAYTDDDRLVIETLRSAHRWGAVCVNYTKAEEPSMRDGKIQGVFVRDAASGERKYVAAKHVVSSLGPWTDQVASEWLDSWKALLRPTKGIHLTFRKERLPLKDAVVMSADKEGRIVFGIPRREMVIVGTTDTGYDGDPEKVRSLREDVDYLLNITNEYFPGANLTEEDVVASYAGIRPLVKDDSGSESKTSREHLILSDPRNITFVTGGKYTTYRRMAEQTVNRALETFNFDEKVRFGKNKTRSPLNPKVTEDELFRSKAEVEEWSHKYGMSQAALVELVERHGGEAREILEQYASGLSIQGDWDDLWKIEAKHAIHQTMCLHLIDFYLRRSPLFLARPDHGWGILSDLADLFARELGWDKTQKDEEIGRLKEHLQYEMEWTQKSSS